MTMLPKRNILRHRVNRRAFLRGAGGITIGLPFLEGLPERSAWAADQTPTFAFFIVSACGVVQKDFWPSTTGALTAESMAGKAVEPIAEFADNLLVVKGITYPSRSFSGCGHAEGLVQALTGVKGQSGGPGAQAGGISADMVISNAQNPQGVDPLTLYSGKGYYIAERVSFGAAGTARSAQLNPYAAFQTLMGVSDSAPDVPAEPGTAPPAEPTVTDDLLIRRKSVNDTVREEVLQLLASSKLSSDDRARLDQHMDAIREIEVNMVSTGETMMEVTGPVAGCALGGIDQSGIEAFKNGINFSQQGNMIEDVVKLHSEVVALAFACNANRVATLQWGDGTDGTRYAGVSGPDWPFHQISHRVQSDASLGNNADAERAHAEIDKLRMGTFAHTIQHFKDRGLLDKSIVYFTSHCAEGSHNYDNLPVIIAGDGGGRFKQGEYIEIGSTPNTPLLNSFIEAAGATPNGEGLSQILI
jgi:hypothetical protein